MSEIQNIGLNLQTIVESTSKDSYLIPQFQRDFKWGVKDISDLGDSIVRGYPIGSLLVMPNNGSLSVGSHSLLPAQQSNNPNNDIRKNDTQFYVLDGQQRLTSIAQLFLNADSKKTYYFDLLAILIDRFPDDNIQEDFGVKETWGKSKAPDLFCRPFAVTQDKSEKPTRINNRYISGLTIIEKMSSSVISKFLSIFFNTSSVDIDKYTNYLNAILSAVPGYAIPVTTIPADSELGVVIRVFEKINSTGRKLTLFDLINAKSFQVTDKAYNKSLSGYITDSCFKTCLTQPEFKKGIHSVLGFGFDETKKNSVFKRLDRVTRIIEIAHLLKKGAKPAVSKTIMLKREAEFWFKQWDQAKDLLPECFAWMESEGLIDIGQMGFLEYLLAVFIANPDSFRSTKFKTEIKRYALSLSIHGAGFDKSNLDVVKRFYNISKQITDSHASVKYNYEVPVISVNLTTEDVLSIFPTNAKFKAIMNLFYQDKLNGMFTVDIYGLPLKGSMSTSDMHHLFPKSRVTKFTAGSQFNSIANFVMLDSDINRETIKDLPMSNYFSVINESMDGVSSCQRNLIDINEAMAIENESEAVNFIRSRAEVIAKKVNEHFIIRDNASSPTD